MKKKKLSCFFFSLYKLYYIYIDYKDSLNRMYRFKPECNIYSITVEIRR